MYCPFFPFCHPIAFHSISFPFLPLLPVFINGKKSKLKLGLVKRIKSPKRIYTPRDKLLHFVSIASYFTFIICLFPDLNSTSFPVIFSLTARPSSCEGTNVPISPLLNLYLGCFFEIKCPSPKLIRE